MAQVKITVRPNGPFRVEAAEGSIELVDANGTPYDIAGKPAFSLCRCGGSAAHAGSAPRLPTATTRTPHAPSPTIARSIMRGRSWRGWS